MSDIYHSNLCMKTQRFLDTVDPTDYCRCGQTKLSTPEQSQSIPPIQTRVEWEHSTSDNSNEGHYRIMKVVNGKWIPLTAVVGSTR